jgi:hypothetical protein
LDRSDASDEPPHCNRTDYNIDDFRIKLCPFALLQLGDNDIEPEALSVRAIRCHGVYRI